MLRPRLRIPRAAVPVAVRPAARRSMHHMPPLPHDFREGVPGLLSAEGFDMAWTQHMTLMLDKLNAMTADTEYAQKDIKQIVLSTAREPKDAPLFNHASMAHNNHFFFRNLSPKPVEMPAALRRGVEDSFGSVETLRRELLVTASAMFGPGFVWLVKASVPGAAHDASFRVLPTYLAGSPYPGAHWRRQAVDMNTVGASADVEGQGAVTDYLRRQVGAISGGGRAGGAGAAAQQQQMDDQMRLAPGGIHLVPILCLNTWEHVWLRDYGLGVGGYGGKRAFVEAWWDAIDWEAVAGLANISRKSLQYGS
ncbi:uncharacterized protein E0L32_001067 [Thyridium curvatum]|uniref:Manganese/iron superoxide dismutase C-terminal domain-containing protein n=1 Tax=Thyridium curvatum TaxID=1093900 RepID=A0A507B1T2_9PEZI|nr:uncharacterized protein E0L32_001067 [Thyridium curvatum]TPX11249.1 hypothetical protein E0L32_001067 [Thyridium curvatum]